ncbi:hypothetical protein M440DRAFT_293414 [Trichoderma longibrachiatum ATCC 18648]|uniref:Uncharacterized protein n=1 Tax=Trichoderma longibrachiatum ATCC 18648 TaxID=983965 RepID=A0A2T4C8H2_TRILO|nr:hypothetical protein M440DRAFT_293414 [Trichoderma longibrachiatum ATCC 18648]
MYAEPTPFRSQRSGLFSSSSHTPLLPSSIFAPPPRIKTARHEYSGIGRARPVASPGYIRLGGRLFCLFSSTSLRPGTSLRPFRPFFTRQLTFQRRQPLLHLHQPCRETTCDLPGSRTGRRRNSKRLHSGEVTHRARRSHDFGFHCSALL